MIDLTWTQPRHGPVEEVIVVRTTGEWPTGPEDGKVVFRTEDVNLGEAMSVEDRGRRGVQYRYAVYSYDGSQWLSWTRPGFNADVGIADNGAGGCGCASVSPVGSGMWAAGLLGLLGLRRRRRSA